MKKEGGGWGQGVKIRGGEVGTKSLVMRHGFSSVQAYERR